MTRTALKSPSSSAARSFRWVIVLRPRSTYREIIADSFAALNWMVDQASELGIDSRRVAIGGRSAGGGLSAGLALYNRDNKGPDLVIPIADLPDA